MNQIDAYPLTWPAGYKRTASGLRTYSRFDQSFGKAQQSLHNEVARLGGHQLIVSTNLRMKKDGMLYADELNRKIDDPGVAVYFKYKSKDVAMCCDKFLKIWENMYALAKGIEALRGMERWGVSDFLDRAFTGFAALPASFVTPYKRDWWEVLGISKDADEETIRQAYLIAAKIKHPDAGGTTEQFQELTQAYQDAIK